MNKYQQIHEKDCGIVVIQKIYNDFYGKNISLSSMRSNINYDENGINLLELKSISHRLGLKLNPIKGDFDSFRNNKFKLPIITIIKTEHMYLHYVIIEKILSNKIIIFDPVYGKRKFNYEEFEKIYSNIIILVTKEKSKNPLINKSEIKLFEIKYWKEIVFISFINCFLLISTFILTFYLRVVIDNLVPNHSFNKILVVSISFLVLTIFKIIIDSFVNIFMHKVELKCQLDFIEVYISKLFMVNWLKISTFDESVHLKNFDLLFKISAFKTKYILTIFSNSFALVFSSIILIILETKVFFILFVLSIFITLITYLFRNKFKTIEKQNISYSTRSKKYFFNIINSISQCKFSGNDFKLKKIFNDSLDEVIANQITYTNYFSIFSILIDISKSIIPYVIVIFSISRVWDNDLSLGQLIMFLSLSNFFLNPFSSLTSFILEIPIQIQYLDNFNSFLNLENEKTMFANNKIEKINKIKIKNLNFSYNQGKDLLKIEKLEINHNLHIIGKNGSGKTTLLKILSTLIILEDEIYFNDKSICFYDLELLRKQICIISSNDYLPYGSIYDYLASNQESAQKLLENIEKYDLIELLAKLNLSFHTLMDENGRNLSSGQKQMISLLKIFTSNYSLILLDEAFENIDNEMLLEIKSKLEKYLEGKIVIEISHRNNFLFKNSEVLNCETYK